MSTKWSVFAGVATVGVALMLCGCSDDDGSGNGDGNPSDAPSVTMPAPDPADGDAVGVAMSSTQITTDIEHHTALDTAIQQEVMLLFAANPGGNTAPVTEPSPTPPSLSLRPPSRSIDDMWFGPDGLGWYWRSYRTGYGGDDWYTEMVRHLGPPTNVIERKTSLSYSGGDGSFSYDTYSRIHRNDDGRLDGYYDFKTDNSGFSTISDSEFEFKFFDYETATGAGLFEWWMGANSLGASFEPFHEFLSMNVTVKSVGPPLVLHVHAYCHEPGAYRTDWEYDTTHSPDDLPSQDDVFW